MTLGRSITATATRAAAVILCLLPSVSAGNVFKDHPITVMNRAASPWASPIGELESSEVQADRQGRSFTNRGSGFLVSPCLVLTARHVVYGSDPFPMPGASYDMVFRAGASTTAAFQGHTTAHPVVDGQIGPVGRGDWALLTLDACVGRRFGWFDLSADKQLPANAPRLPIAVAGYSGDQTRGVLSYSKGEIEGSDARNDLVLFNASMTGGQSGGPILEIHNDKLVAVGITVQDFGGPNAGDEVIIQDTYGPGHANEFVRISDVLEGSGCAPPRPNLPPGVSTSYSAECQQKSALARKLISDDLSKFGGPNAAAQAHMMKALP